MIDIFFRTHELSGIISVDEIINNTAQTEDDNVVPSNIGKAFLNLLVSHFDLCFLGHMN